MSNVAKSNVFRLNVVPNLWTEEKDGTIANMKSLKLFSDIVIFGLAQTNVKHNIVFVWSRNGTNMTKAFVKGLLVPEMKIVGGATCWSSNCLYNICLTALLRIILTVTTVLNTVETGDIFAFGLGC